jgi:glutamate-1-semialdehyde 2,1-aminomutase
VTAEKSGTWFERARRVTPGGVNSPVRAFGSVGGTPRFIQSASGARLTDVDGVEYIDYVGSWGPMILGHDHPEVREALMLALASGTSFGAPSPGEVELAEMVVGMVPGVDRVRFVNSGTEATMSALRLARAATGRDGVIKFRGGYHGHADPFLVEAGSGAATLGVPSSPGVTEGAARDTLVAEYNDVASVRTLLEVNAGKVAAIMVEPVAGNMGCVPPRDGFLEALRGLCDEHGALLIFDEVMTGFRLAPGGAQELYGVVPDLTTLGKVIGGGLPVGAFGGRESLMRRVAPEGPVYQAGTLSGNPLAMAAGLATVGHLRENPDVYTTLERLGARLEAGYRRILDGRQGSLSWNRVGSMATLFFSAGPVTGWESAGGADRDRFARYFHGMLERGIYLPPSQFEAAFISAAHTEADIDRTVDAGEEVLAEILT